MVHPQTRHPMRAHTHWYRQLMAIAVAGGILQSPMLVLAEDFTSTQLSNRAEATYSDSLSGPTIQATSGQLINTVDILVDPFGRLKGCAGEELSDYTGFSLALYEADPSDPTGTELKNLVSLTRTEVPDIPNNNIPRGLAPNVTNINPFPLSNSDKGGYNFLLDPAKGQLDVGRSYVLVINTPENSIYSQRRIRITITDRQEAVVAYTATSLDGRPISTTDQRTSVSGTINLRNAEKTGLLLAVLDIDADVCQSQEVQIVKTGDRAAAEPGDTVIYRLSVRNLASAAINNVTATDTLPLGFSFLPKSVRGELNNTPVTITTVQTGSTVTFKAEEITLPATSSQQNSVLNIAYAATLTPDALRGTGQNSAIVNAERADNQLSVKDGPAIHQLRIRTGILSDCGTIIGRVFVDKNFDGEQQPNEPGIPNAVVFMDDGNRITTDPNGLFSVANVISGYRTGVLDLTSLPGYTLAPNLYFKERNSQSRLVHLEPSGLVRMNFAVTPTANEAKAQ